MKTHHLSDEETAQVVSLLSKLDPGFLPEGIFQAITRIVAMSIIEVVPLRISAVGVEILLTEREKDDPVWPGQLHTPGTVIRADDMPGSFDDPFRRILSTELGDVKVSDPVFVKNILHHSGRGMEVSQIFWVDVQGQPSKGAFYNVDELPTNLVQSQLDFIPDAIAHFRSYKRHSA